MVAGVNPDVIYTLERWGFYYNWQKYTAKQIYGIFYAKQKRRRSALLPAFLMHRPEELEEENLLSKEESLKALKEKELNNKYSSSNDDDTAELADIYSAKNLELFKNFLEEIIVIKDDKR